MDFSGFSNSDFEFFKKKNTMEKTIYDERKEEVKRHFREFCYDIQRNYHRITGDTLLLDRNFQGLNKNKNHIYAISKVDKTDMLSLKIELCQDYLNIGFICPPDGDSYKIGAFKELIVNRNDAFVKFFKENKSMFLILYSRNPKKNGEDTWVEEFKFHNNELILGNYNDLINNMNKLQPSTEGSKKNAGIHLGVQFLKADAIKIGKPLSVRACNEISKLLNLYQQLFY